MRLKPCRLVNLESIQVRFGFDLKYIGIQCLVDLASVRDRLLISPGSICDL